jgi:hypothetical protein
MEKTIVKQKL